MPSTKSGDPARIIRLALQAGARTTATSTKSRRPGPDTTYIASFTDRGYALLQRSPGTRPGYYGAHRDRHDAPANPSTKSGHAARILQIKGKIAAQRA